MLPQVLKILGALLAVVFVPLVAVYIGLAGLAAFSVYHGMVSGDTIAAIAYFDKQLLKEKLKESVWAHQSRQSLDNPDIKHEPGERVSAEIAIEVGTRLIDKLPTSVLMAMLYGFRHKMTKTDVKLNDLLIFLSHIRLLGVNRFALLHDKGGELVFTFSAAGWRVTEMNRPPNLMGSIKH